MQPDTLTAEQLDILRHSLGLNDRGKGRMYRNHFVVGPGSGDYEACMSLVKGGFMVRHDGNLLTGGDDCFVVTKAGQAVAQKAGAGDAA